jgi:hypothetical protein
MLDADTDRADLELRLIDHRRQAPRSPAKS